jgi:serine/threonine protein kinase
MAGKAGGGVAPFELQYAGRERASGKQILIKRTVAEPAGGLPTAALKEAYFLKFLKSDYVRELLDIVQAPTSLYLVVQDCGPSLLDILSTRSHLLTLNFRRKVTFNLLKCLEFLQTQGIIHLCISIRTILVDEMQRVRIEGFYRAQRGEKSKGRSNTGQYCVSMSPELVSGQAELTPASDMWSAGVVLLEMIRKERVDWTGSKAEVESLVEGYLKPEDSKSLTQKLREAAPEATSEELDLLQALFSPDPNSRPCAMQALKHPYFLSEHCEAEEED